MSKRVRKGNGRKISNHLIWMRKQSQCWSANSTQPTLLFYRPVESNLHTRPTLAFLIFDS